MSSSKYTYEFVERDEENPLNDRVVKKNVEVEFQMFELDQYTDTAVRQLDEIRAQLNMEDAKQKNVEEHHQDAVSLVSGLDPVKQNAVFIWLRAKQIIDELGPRRDKLEEALKEHEAEVEVIKKQTGWEPPAKEAEKDETNKDEPSKEDVSQKKESRKSTKK